jgi:phage terminase large subunit-like protein
VLEWMAENVQVRSDDNGNIRPVKPDHQSSAKRIDGIVAAVMAIGVGQITKPKAASIYETAGMLTL